jgi:hypothetical protein
MSGAYKSKSSELSDLQHYFALLRVESRRRFRLKGLQVLLGETFQSCKSFKTPCFTPRFPIFIQMTSWHILVDSSLPSARLLPDRKVDVYLICLFELKFGISLCPRLNLFMDQLVGFNKVSHLWLQIEVKICEQVDFKL